MVATVRLESFFFPSGKSESFEKQAPGEDIWTYRVINNGRYKLALCRP